MPFDGPGLSLKWRDRLDGTKVAYWVCSPRKIHANFSPRTVRLWSGKGEPSVDELEAIYAECHKLQQEMIEFAMNPRRNRRLKRTSGKIYFIKSRNLVKIGFTVGSVQVRLGKLQTGSPSPLQLLGYVEGDQVAERQLHWRFRKLHSHGEWFFLQGSLRAYVEKLFSDDSSEEQASNIL